MVAIGLSSGYLLCKSSGRLVPYAEIIDRMSNFEIIFESAKVLVKSLGGLLIGGFIGAVVGTLFGYDAINGFSYMEVGAFIGA